MNICSTAHPSRGSIQVACLHGFSKRYRHIDSGGWWANGVDPETGNELLWGCFKPATTRIDTIKGKHLKYEHPLKVPSELFALRIPLRIWEMVGHRYSVPVSSLDIDKTRDDLGFWKWVIDHPEVPIILTEGVKKAAALLSLGFVAIGVPGIWGAYRKNDGDPCLLPQLECFTKKERDFFFAFDQDEKRKTRRANRKALWSTAKLILSKKCDVKIIEWEPTIKGVDDLIVAKGAAHFNVCYEKALYFRDWQTDQLWELTYKIALKLDSESKYLGDFLPPDTAQLICLKAPKGSGKTEWLTKVCSEAQRLGKKILILTHREQLGAAMCSRFRDANVNIEYLAELEGKNTKGLFGIGLCFDSLRLGSRASFDPDDWRGCIIVLDECEQSIWHLLNARTEVSKHRVQILRNFQKVVQYSLSGGGKIYLSDADLSDVSIDYIKSLVDFPVEPWVAVKEGIPDPWEVTVWGSAAEQLGALKSHIRKGGRPLIFVDGQKPRSKWGTINLEAELKRSFPELNILRIDSKTVSNPQHPAYGCIDKLDLVIQYGVVNSQQRTVDGYDIAIASPTIETGISMDILGHFTSVWDFSQGVIPVRSVLQRMARLREPVPRHVYAPSYGALGRIGNGSCSPRSLMASQQTKFKAHVKLLTESEFVEDDFDVAIDFQPQSLRTWAKMACRLNLGMVRYQHEIIRALLREGHHVKVGNYLQVLASDEDADGTDQINEDLSETRDKQYAAFREAVAKTPNPSDSRYETLQKKRSLTDSEQLEKAKGSLSRKYTEKLVQPELIELDDKGEYQKARTHYYLTVGREFLPGRDKEVMEGMLESGDGELFLPDATRKLVGGKIKFLEFLEVPKLFAEDTEWTNSSPELINLSEKIRKFAKPIEDVLGIKVSEDATPVVCAQKILRQCLGVAFSSPIKKGSRGNQIRYYQPIQVSQLRQQLLDEWLKQDNEAKAEKLAAIQEAKEREAIDAKVELELAAPLIQQSTESEEVTAEPMTVTSQLDTDVEFLRKVNDWKQVVIPQSRFDRAWEVLALFEQQRLTNLYQKLLIDEALHTLRMAQDWIEIEAINPDAYDAAWQLLNSSEQQRVWELSGQQQPGEPSWGITREQASVWGARFRWIKGGIVRVAYAAIDFLKLDNGHYVSYHELAPI